MERNFENLIELLSDTESIKSDDALSKIVNPDLDDELSETELDNVSAAAKQDYQKFLRRLEQSKEWVICSQKGGQL